VLTGGPFGANSYATKPLLSHSAFAETFTAESSRTA